MIIIASAREAAVGPSGLPMLGPPLVKGTVGPVVVVVVAMVVMMVVGRGRGGTRRGVVEVRQVWVPQYVTSYV